MVKKFTNISYAIGEVKELIEEIKQKDLKKSLNELYDIYICLMCYFKKSTNLNIQKSGKSWLEQEKFFIWYL
ncbi:MAG: MazG nucleotide pyrophosphohydrolase domain-containing protein [Candidatus Caldatribacteriota bacterium]|nr:hypothetical protein [Patescibacteria group bacterium]